MTSTYFIPDYDEKNLNSAISYCFYAVYKNTCVSHLKIDIKDTVERIGVIILYVYIFYLIKLVGWKETIDEIFRKLHVEDKNIM